MCDCGIEKILKKYLIPDLVNIVMKYKGPFGPNIKEINTNYTIERNDYIINVNSKDGVKIYLPDASDENFKYFIGKTIHIINISYNYACIYYEHRDITIYGYNHIISFICNGIDWIPIAIPNLKW